MSDNKEHMNSSTSLQVSTQCQRAAGYRVLHDQNIAIGTQLFKEFQWNVFTVANNNLHKKVQKNTDSGQGVGTILVQVQGTHLLGGAWQMKFHSH